MVQKSKFIWSNTKEMIFLGFKNTMLILRDFIDIFIKSSDIDKWSRAYYQFGPILEDEKLVYVPVKLLYILNL